MTRYLPLVFGVLAALGCGLMIVPGAWEMAFMKLRDKDFAAAERAFEDKYLAGDRSRGVLLPLSELYVRKGRIDKAISVLTKYRAAHPDDREVTARLADLLREAQDTPRAVAALEALSASNPDAAALRELDRQYDIAENVEGRIGALSRLAKAGAATAKESLTLTNLLAAKGQKKEALTAAFNAAKALGPKTPHELIQVFVALAIDSGRPDLIETAVRPWMAGQSVTPPVQAVASALVDKGQAKAAIALVEASAPFKKGADEAIVLAAQLEAMHGDKAKALELFTDLLKAGRLPPTQDATYVTLAFAAKRPEDGLAHVAKRGPNAFDDPLLLYAIDQAVRTGQQDWLKAFDAALAQNAERPLPRARLALALGDRTEALSLARAAEESGSTVALAHLYSELGDMASAMRAFQIAVPSPDQAAPQDLAQAAAVAIALKAGPMALALAERLAAQDKGTEAAIQRARALTLNGRAAEALDILAALNATGELAETAEIEALAAAKRFAQLRTKLFAKLSQPDLPKSQRTNAIYLLNDLKIALGAEAAPLAKGLEADLADNSLSGAPREARLTLLAKVAPAKAVPFMKAAAEADPEIQGYAYVKLLKDLNRQAELRAYLLLAAKTAKQAKTRDDYLFELLKHGAGTDALPLLAERARTGGQNWFYAYDQALAKTGARAERLAALEAFADRPETPHELRKQIAFQVLELGDKPRAETMFRKLAANAAPNAPELQQLLYLWGPRPSDDARAWLKNRAAAARPEDRTAWAKILANAGDAKGAESVLAGAEDPASVATLAGIYAETRNARALAALIKTELPNAGAETALALAKAADALSMSADASAAYERAGRNEEAGRAAFFAGDHQRAIKFLERGRPDGRTAFYLAEALVASRRQRDAVTHYRAALEKLGRNPEERKMRIVALARLKDHVAAEREIGQLNADPADEAEARNAYAAALMDQGDTVRARGQLGY